MNIYEQLAANFYRWEQRGRGVEVFPAAVELEPPFVPFPGHRLRLGDGSGDSGAKQTMFSRLAGKVFRALQPPKQELTEMTRFDADEAEQMPDWFGEREPVEEIEVRLPVGASYPVEAIAHFLTTCSLVSGLMGLEFVATPRQITLLVVCQAADLRVVAAQLAAQFPDAKLSFPEAVLRDVWADDEDESERLVLEFGLHQEFMRPLEAPGRTDPFVSLIGGMRDLRDGEVAVYQCLFTPVHKPWAENVMAAVTKENGKPFFDDGADLVKQAQAKVSRPLYAVVLRLAARCPAESGLRRTWDIVRGMAPALRLFSREGGQSLTPLRNLDYDHNAHCDDLLWRRSRRSGMLLNLDELTGLVHWPSPAVKCEKLRRVADSTSRPAPHFEEEDIDAGTLILGENIHDGEETTVILQERQRLQHVHCLGASGTGKSTLLLSMLLQDMAQGRGFALLDPHGDLLDRILAEVPEDRLDDVILIDPSDEQNIVPFNVLSAHSDYEKTLLASDLVSVFRRLSTSWGDRMDVIFKNLVHAFLEHREGGTLSDMRRFLQEPDWRQEFLSGVDDPDVKYYWEQTFPRLDGPKSIAPILTRLEVLLTPKVIRYMVSQKENRIDFSRIMDESRILLVRLPMGQIGKEVSYMLGSLVVLKLSQMAMGRARMAARARTPFFCYVDECQNFMTPSLAEILSGARKYGLGLVLAHQDMHQLQQCGDVAAAVMTNAATRIVFRVSEGDARILKGDFAHYEPKDFAALKTFEAICRIERADNDFNLRVVRPADLDEAEAGEQREAAIGASRERYTIPREQVEAELRERLTKDGGRPDSRRRSDTGRGERPVKSDLPAAAASNESDVPNAGQAEDDKLGTSQVLPAGAALAVQAPKDAGSSPGRGKGGPEHKAFQGIIRRTAERLGFRAALEHPVGGGTQSVDVVLTRDDLRIACEISVSTPVEHEFANLSKCLPEDFTLIALISEDAGHREKLRILVDTRLAEIDAARVFSGSCEEFIDYLESLPAATEGDERRVRGYKVKRKFVELTAEERQRISEQAFNLLAEEMKQPPPRQ